MGRTRSWRGLSEQGVFGQRLFRTTIGLKSVRSLRFKMTGERRFGLLAAGAVVLFGPIVMGQQVPGTSEPGVVSELRIRSSASVTVSGSSKVVAVDARGVTTETDGALRLIGWDQVSLVTGTFAEAFEPFRAVATDAWRARVRLERGDLAAAEPIFERLFSAYAGQSGPTAGVIGAGLMRCRLERGAQVGAIEPWLAFVQSREPSGKDGATFESSGTWTLDRATGRPAIDELSGLAPGLPPIWLGTNAEQIAAKLKPAEWLQTDGPVGALADLYSQSLRVESSLEVTLPDRPMAAGSASSGYGAPTTASEGVLFVQEVVASRAGSAELRAAARSSLRARLSKSPPSWVEAWCRVALGRSLVREASRDEQLLGVVELMHLPSRLESENPYLAGIALAEGALAMLRLGDDDGAARLRHDLFARFPGHPATEYEPLRGWVHESGAMSSESSTAQSPASSGPSVRPSSPPVPNPASTLPGGPP